MTQLFQLSFALFLLLFVLFAEARRGTGKGKGKGIGNNRWNPSNKENKDKGKLVGTTSKGIIEYYSSKRMDIDSDIQISPTSQPPSKVPTSEKPSSEAPYFEAPLSEAPYFKATYFEVPSFEALFSENSTFEAPFSETPFSETSYSEDPYFEAPYFEVPSFEAPFSEAPYFEAPFSETLTFEKPTWEQKLPPHRSPRLKPKESIEEQKPTTTTPTITTTKEKIGCYKRLAVLGSLLASPLLIFMFQQLFPNWANYFENATYKIEQTSTSKPNKVLNIFSLTVEVVLIILLSFIVLCGVARFLISKCVTARNNKQLNKLKGKQKIRIRTASPQVIMAVQTNSQRRKKESIPEKMQVVPLPLKIALNQVKKQIQLSSPVNSVFTSTTPTSTLITSPSEKSNAIMVSKLWQTSNQSTDPAVSTGFKINQLSSNAESLATSKMAKYN